MQEIQHAKSTPSRGAPAITKNNAQHDFPASPRKSARETAHILGSATRRIVEAAMSMIGDPKIERLVEHLHLLGPRPLAEFLSALATAYGIGQRVVDQLEEYHRLTPAMVAAVGADQFPRRVLVAVRGGRQ